MWTLGSTLSLLVHSTLACLTGRESANELGNGQSLDPLIMLVTAILSHPSLLGLITQGSLHVLSPWQAYTYTALLWAGHPLISFPDYEADRMGEGQYLCIGLGMGGMAWLKLAQPELKLQPVMPDQLPRKFHVQLWNLIPLITQGHSVLFALRSFIVGHLETQWEGCG